MKCPVCENEIVGFVCRECGFDESANCEKYPTIGLYEAEPVSISKRSELFVPQWNASGIDADLRLEILAYNAWNGSGRAQRDLAEYYYGAKKYERFDFWKKSAENLGYKVDCSDAHYENSFGLNKLSTKCIRAGRFSTVRVCSDGKCISTNISDSKVSCGQDRVSDWTDIVDVAVGNYHTVGLKRDGTVVSTRITKETVEIGNKIYRTDYGQTQISGWHDIAKIDVGASWTIGLKKDGTLVYCGENLNRSELSKWNSLSDIAVSSTVILGLKMDGTVVASSKCNVSEWKDIDKISAGLFVSAGLKKDGTVVSTKERSTSYYVSDAFKLWKDIKAISSGGTHTVGLKNDGTVAAAGNNSLGQCNVSKWKDIVGISAGTLHTAGMKSNGEIVAAGDNSYGQCNINELFGR